MSGEGRRGGCGFGGKVAFGREEKENKKGFGLKKRGPNGF